MTRNAETARGVAGPFQKDSAAGGGSASIVAHPRLGRGAHRNGAPYSPRGRSARRNPHRPSPRDGTPPMTAITPGAWPVNQSVDLATHNGAEATRDALYVQRASEEARRHFIGASVRQHLAEQPTAIAVRAVLRHYISDFTQWADEVIAAMSSTENKE